jgi:hypothetical protein
MAHVKYAVLFSLSIPSRFFKSFLILAIGESAYLAECMPGAPSSASTFNPESSASAILFVIFAASNAFIYAFSR